MRQSRDGSRVREGEKMRGSRPGKKLKKEELAQRLHRNSRWSPDVS